MIGSRTSTKESFEKYLLTEYNNIANAHFNTINTISSFFRYYLIIMSIPITILSAALVLIVNYKGEPLSSLSTVGLVLISIFLSISIIGFLLSLYIANLRFDAIMYARSVNGIRKYFFDNWKTNIRDKLGIRVLPQAPGLPRYLEKEFFFPVVLSFAIFNSLYLFMAVSLWQLLYLGRFVSLVISLFVSAAFIGGHVATYIGMSRYRENRYLRGKIIGVDIDGVLNEHRDKFTQLLQAKTGKTLSPADVISIPVHEIPSTNITETDEKAVFNDPAYWIDMPLIKYAVENLNKLRNAFKFKIYIFTYRPWPNPKETNLETWKKATRAFNFRESRFLESIRIEFLLWRKQYINVITRRWLQKNGIPFDRLIVEKGNEVISDPYGNFRNRFYLGRKKNIRIFVEDDAQKASKLAYICDLVFLINQPYNANEPVPTNVIRVDSWTEIYREIRRLL